jgi:hypothetical protein
MFDNEQTFSVGTDMLIFSLVRLIRVWKVITERAMNMDSAITRRALVKGSLIAGALFAGKSVAFAGWCSGWVKIGFPWCDPAMPSVCGKLDHPPINIRWGIHMGDRARASWTKETFARAHKAREVLPEIFPAGSCCQDVEAPRTTEIGQGAYINLPPIAAGDIGALEGHGSWLANTDGRSIVESCLIDV